MHKIFKFIKEDVWRIRMNKLSRRRSFWIRQLRIILLAIRGFDEDKCLMRASALTYFSLLSIVPLVAMAFGIAKGFGFEKVLEKQLQEKLVGQEEVVGKIIVFSQTMLDNTKGGLIAGIGVAVLVWTVIKMLGNIEHSFNEIWGIRKGRTIGRKFSDYLSIMFICPILLIMSSSVTVFVTSQVNMIVEKVSILGAFGTIILNGLQLLPYVMLWMAFTFIYIFMPNTKVKFRSALLAGVIAGSIFQLVQWAYITFQIGASKYGAIYGSFAALPLFLIWLQLSWLVVLFGAEVSFAEQNVETYEMEPDCLNVSRKFKDLVALIITHLCVKDFVNVVKKKSAEEIAQTLELPIRLVKDVLYELTEADVLAEVALDDGKTLVYQPARDPEQLSVGQVLFLLRQKGSDNIPLSESEDVQKVVKQYAHFTKFIDDSKKSFLLKDL